MNHFCREAELVKHAFMWPKHFAPFLTPNQNVRQPLNGKGLFGLQKNVLNDNKITHYTFVLYMWSLSIVTHCGCSQNYKSMTMGWQTVIRWKVGRTIKYCKPPLGCYTPNQTQTGDPPPVSAPCLQFKQLLCFVEMASGCLFSFLSFYFLPFFRGISSCSS